MKYVYLLMFAMALPAVADERLPAGTVVLDADLLAYPSLEARISPNGKWIAYESRGALWVCNVVDAEPRKLMDLPNTQTEVLSRPGEVRARDAYFNKGPALSRDEFAALQRLTTHSLGALQWTHDSAQLIWCYGCYNISLRDEEVTFWFAKPSGEKTVLVQVQRGVSERGLGVNCILTRDRRHFVQPHYRLRPLIWDVVTNKPLATPFLHLTPSSLSDRWIGVEKDTRQLVITDADFRVVQRFEEYLPTTSFGFQLLWSQDERYILWRNQIGFDHFSNWEGFRMDLDTLEKVLLDGRIMDETFQFTSNAGEFLRFGLVGEKTNDYDRIAGAHFVLYPSATGAPTDVWRLSVESKDPATGATMIHLPPRSLIANSNYDLFAMRKPRLAGERWRLFWHLIDRDGRTWPFPGPDADLYDSPWRVVGFADKDSKIICYDRNRLFAVPVSEILDAPQP